MAQLGINLGLLILQVLNFAIVLILLYKWAYTPILNMLAKTPRGYRPRSGRRPHRG